MNNDFFSIDFKHDHLIFIDQTKLPLSEEYIKTDNYNRIAEAIEKLEIRGAPAIGVAAAYAIALALKNIQENIGNIFDAAVERLSRTRPTAVNLFWAIDKMISAFNNGGKSFSAYEELLNAARNIHIDDKNKCEKIAQNALKLFDKKMRILTHCNTGSLATSGIGTALGAIKRAYEKGLVELVYVDETRPLMQGSRLTAFELSKSSIPFSINIDSTAALLMKDKKVDLVIVGADRIAANGDAANKIGTYNLAVLCKHHKIPFYIAAPTSTIDPNCVSGKDIVVEFRDKKELTTIGGRTFTLPEYDYYNPAFDVSPFKLISGIITEKGLFKPPYSFKNVKN